MQMQDFLLEHAPELFNQIAPGGIARQDHQLNGQMPGSPPFACGWTWLVRPVVGSRKRKGTFLRFQGHQHIWVKVNRPIALDQPNALHSWIGLTDLSIQFDKLFDPHFPTGCAPTRCASRGENPNLFVSDVHFAMMLVIRYTEERSCCWLFLCEKDSEWTHHPSRS